MRRLTLPAAWCCVPVQAARAQEHGRPRGGADGRRRCSPSGADLTVPGVSTRWKSSPRRFLAVPARCTRARRIAWIGLLYYFNVVQVPAFAAYGDEARARNVSIDKLASRALWWFRWAAIVTLVLGLLIVGATENYMENFMSDDPSNKPRVGCLDPRRHAVRHPDGLERLDGHLEEPEDRARQRGERARRREADPGAAAAGRRALLASRTNFILSFSMLWFMVGTSHFYTVFGADSSGKAYTFVLIAVCSLPCSSSPPWGVLGAPLPPTSCCGRSSRTRTLSSRAASCGSSLHLHGDLPRLITVDRNDEAAPHGAAFVVLDVVSVS